MTDYSININVGTDHILDLNSNEQGEFIAFTSSNKVYTNNHTLTIDQKFDSPLIRKLDGELFLITDCWAFDDSNGYIYNLAGHLIKSFYIGDAIQDIIIHCNKIVVTFSDEAVFDEDDEPNSNGLVIFDFSGQQLFGINSSIDTPKIHHCNCICKHKADTVLFYTYPDLSVCELNVETFNFTMFDTPTYFSGATAISSTSEMIIFHSSYKEPRSFFSWDKINKEVKKFGSYSPNLRGIGNGKFLTFGDKGFTIINPLD